MTKESIINLINEKENERIRLQEEIDSLKKQLEIYDNNQNKTVNILSKEEKIKYLWIILKGEMIHTHTFPLIKIPQIKSIIFQHVSMNGKRVFVIKA